MKLRIRYSANLVAVCLLAGCGRIEMVDGKSEDVASEIVASQSLENSSDWPMLFGPLRTSVADSSFDISRLLAGQFEPLWELQIGTGYGSPVISKNCTIFNYRVGDEDVVQCVETLTGSEIWQYRSPDTFKCTVDYSSGPYSTPLVFEDRVFCVGAQGHFACLDLATGNVIWKRELHDEFSVEVGLFPVGSSPLVVDDIVVFNLGASDSGAGVIGLDTKTGQTRWTATDHGAAYCVPFATVIDEQPYVFVITAFGLVSLNPYTGAVDWEIEHASRLPMAVNAVSPIMQGNRVVAVTGPGPGAICVKVLPDRTYREVWQDRKVLDSQFNSLLLADGNLYGFTTASQNGAEFRCVDFQTGELKWKYQSPLGRGQGVIVGENIILVGEKGHFAILERSAKRANVRLMTQEPVWPAPCYCAPAITEHALILKHEHRVIALRID